MSVKKDLLREIEARAARRKKLSRELTVEKTVASLASVFFSRSQEARDLDMEDYLLPLAFANLVDGLNKLDPHCAALLKRTADQELQVEIIWSEQYADRSGCDRTLVLDAATAAFQEVIDRL